MAPTAGWVSPCAISASQTPQWRCCTISGRARIPRPPSSLRSAAQRRTHLAPELATPSRCRHRPTSCPRLVKISQRRSSVRWCCGSRRAQADSFPRRARRRPRWRQCSCILDRVVLRYPYQLHHPSGCRCLCCARHRRSVWPLGLCNAFLHRHTHMRTRAEAHVRFSCCTAVLAVLYRQWTNCCQNCAHQSLCVQ